MLPFVVVRKGPYAHETVAIKIASLVLDHEPRAYEAPSFYVHATAPVVPVKTYEDAMPEAWALNGSGTFDFTTFINGLSVMKWRRYTVARRFVLRLTYKGAAASIWQTRADSFAWEPEVMEDTCRSLPASSVVGILDAYPHSGPMSARSHRDTGWKYTR